jgi:signal transduction histidine kinase
METVAAFTKNPGQPFQGLVYGLCGRDGKVRYFDVNGGPFFTPDGRLRGFIGSSHDISERVFEQRRVGHELRRLAVLDSLFHQTAAALDEFALMDSVCRSVVHDLDYDGCVIYESMPEMRTARMRHAYPERHRYVVRESLQFDDCQQYRVLVEGRQYYSTEMSTELPHIGAWGIERVAAVPLGTGTTVTGALVVLGNDKKDFSEDERQTLDMIARELSITLDRVRTHQSLRQANQRLNLMSSIIRHDLHNQILIASGNLTIAQEDPATTAAGIRDAMVALNRMEDMLRFSRHYQDIGIESPRWFNPRELWSQSVLSSSANHVNIYCSIPACLIQADPMVVRVLPNLIDNSLRHGGKVSAISLHGVCEGQGLQLTYSDDGVGLAEKERNSIFDIKYRGRHGHGLHLVREVLGITDISIESLPSPQGVKFLMRVPPHRCRIFDVV